MGDLTLGINAGLSNVDGYPSGVRYAVSGGVTVVKLPGWEVALVAEHSRDTAEINGVPGAELALARLVLGFKGRIFYPLGGGDARSSFARLTAEGALLGGGSRGPGVRAPSLSMRAGVGLAIRPAEAISLTLGANLAFDLTLGNTRGPNVWSEAMTAGIEAGFCW